MSYRSLLATAAGQSAERADREYRIRTGAVRHHTPMRQRVWLRQVRFRINIVTATSHALAATAHGVRQADRRRARLRSQIFAQAQPALGQVLKICHTTLERGKPNAYEAAKAGIRIGV